MAYKHLIPYNNMSHEAKLVGGPEKYKNKLMTKGGLLTVATAALFFGSAKGTSFVYDKIKSKK